MKHTLSLAIIMMLAISGVFAKDNKERTSKLTTVKGTNVSVTYEEPSKNGRVIFGKTEENPVMVYGKVWDESARITITKDCTVGGNKKQLKAGTYNLFVTPAQGEWLFYFNTDANQTAAGFDKNSPQNVVRTWALTKHLDHSVETYTVAPQQDGLLLEWDQVSVLLPIEFSK